MFDLSCYGKSRSYRSKKDQTGRPKGFPTPDHSFHGLLFCRPWAQALPHFSLGPGAFFDMTSQCLKEWVVPMPGHATDVASGHCGNGTVGMRRKLLGTVDRVVLW